MLGFGPISSRPISGLILDTLSVAVECDTIVECRMDSPLFDLVSDPRKQLVMAVEITTVTIG